MNPLRDLFRSSKQKKIEQELLDVTRRARPRGVELPHSEVELAAAAQVLIARHPELTIIQTGQTISLYHRADLDVTTSRELRGSLERAGLLLHQQNKG